MNLVNNREKRIISFDILRVIASFAVVMLHISGGKFFSSYPSYEWIIRIVYGSLVRWCVPVFIMISGALFLDLSKSISIKKLYTHNVFHILCVFLFWSLIYSVYNAINRGSMDILVLIEAIYGEYHLWFLKMLIGLYVAVPIMRIIVQNRRIEEYFIIISVVTTFVIPMMITVIGLFNLSAKDFAEGLYKGFGLHIAAGYMGYFVLGHYFNTYKLELRLIKVIYFLGCSSVASAILLTYWGSHHIGAACDAFYGYLNPLTLFESLAMFLFVSRIRINYRMQSFIIKLSGYCLGIYLIHELIHRMVYDFIGIDSSTLNPFFFIPCLSLLIFIVSCFIIAVLAKIPIVRRIVM